MRGKRNQTLTKALSTPLPLGLNVARPLTEDELLNAYDFAADLKATGQDPIWHQEGDVLTHTVMVINELFNDKTWDSLSPERQAELYWAALLHDVAKPETTQVIDGKIRSPYHASRGATRAREILWRAGVNPASRERICQMVQHHMAISHLITNDQIQSTSRAIWISLGCNAEDMIRLARADTKGRIGSGLNEQLEKLELAEMLFDDLNCLNNPYAFASDHARFRYFHDQKSDPTYAAWNDRIGVMHLTHGLPGSGKDYHVAKEFKGLPVISLDEIRATYKLPATGNQGEVIQKAKEMAKAHLRKGEDFVWNATNLTRDLRAPLIQLADDYKFAINVLQVESPYKKLFIQNQDREATVPVSAIERMIRKWQVPDLKEVHTIKLAES